MLYIICLCVYAVDAHMSSCERIMSDQSSQSKWQLAAENSQNSQNSLNVRLTVFSVLSDLHTTLFKCEKFLSRGSETSAWRSHVQKLS